MTPRETAFCAIADFEAVMKATRLPCLIIVGLPEEQGFMRASFGMGEKGNRELFKITIVDYLQKMESTNGGADEPV